MQTANSKFISLILEHCRTRYQEQEYPALKTQTERWKQTRPLQGIRILDATPLYTNTLMKYVPLLTAGASVTAAIDDAIPYDSGIPSLLKEWGFPCLQNVKSGDFDCILDCGGIHAGLTPKYGFAELTRSGAYHFQNTEKPVIFVDDSRIKMVETCLGTGNGFLRGMKQCGFHDFKQKEIVLFGYGKVGRGVAYFLQKEGASVTVVDNPEISVRAGLKFISRTNLPAIADAVRNAWGIVTATGIANAMKGNGAAEILRNTKQPVAAVGIENEWGDSLPPDRILNHGRPINFILEEPTLLRYIDPTMALGNAAALELVSNKLPAGIQKIDSAVEQDYWTIIKNNHLIRKEIEGAGL